MKNPDNGLKCVFMTLVNLLNYKAIYVIKFLNFFNTNRYFKEMIFFLK